MLYTLTSITNLFKYTNTLLSPSNEDIPIEVSDAVLEMMEDMDLDNDGSESFQFQLLITS